MLFAGNSEVCTPRMVRGHALPDIVSIFGTFILILVPFIAQYYLYFQVISSKETIK